MGEEGERGDDDRGEWFSWREAVLEMGTPRVDEE